MRAFIGTRRLGPEHTTALFLFQRAAARAGVVRTGAAPGADQEAAEMCLDTGGRVELCLPWSGFEDGWILRMQKVHPGRVSFIIYTPSQHPHWAQDVRDYHPAAATLTRGAFALHARNSGIVEGVSAVVALPRRTGEGGTQQGIRIARARGVRVFDLSTGEGMRGLEEVLEKGGEW